LIVVVELPVVVFVGDQMLAIEAMVSIRVGLAQNGHLLAELIQASWVRKIGIFFLNIIYYQFSQLVQCRPLFIISNQRNNGIRKKLPIRIQKVENWAGRKL
jgi:hypothetical protein